jgi:hypothetical protein
MQDEDPLSLVAFKPRPDEATHQAETACRVRQLDELLLGVCLEASFDLAEVVEEDHCLSSAPVGDRRRLRSDHGDHLLEIRFSR